jgi:hypothetical protein
VFGLDRGVTGNPRVSAHSGIADLQCGLFKPPHHLRVPLAQETIQNAELLVRQQLRADMKSYRSKYLAVIHRPLDTVAPEDARDGDLSRRVRVQQRIEIRRAISEKLRHGPQSHLSHRSVRNSMHLGRIAELIDGCVENCGSDLGSSIGQRGDTVFRIPEKSLSDRDSARQAGDSSAKHSIELNVAM